MSLSIDIVLFDGSQYCSCRYKAKVSRMKVDIVNEVWQVINESTDVYHSNVTDIVRGFWKADLMNKDPFQTVENMTQGEEKDRGEEDEDNKEEADDAEDKVEYNLEYGAPSFRTNKMEVDANPFGQIIEIVAKKNSGGIDVIEMLQRMK
ncbi:hypothetical protein TorRG33x02_325740 [Trema orientale]|uniref:Uncharacterized protein n=1 Tax=Trema orientale TaxID=63057 RepID=A0A2P5BCN5_TREOI|nr:hypothetical protein TorRG33x02_325740 [Trema orientale]